MPKFVKFVGNLCHRHGHKPPKTRLVLAGLFVLAKGLFSGRAGGDKNNRLSPTYSDYRFLS